MSRAVEGCALVRAGDDGGSPQEYILAEMQRGGVGGTFRGAGSLFFFFLKSATQSQVRRGEDVWLGSNNL